MEPYHPGNQRRYREKRVSWWYWSISGQRSTMSKCIEAGAWRICWVAGGQGYKIWQVFETRDLDLRESGVGIFPSATSQRLLHWLLYRGVFLAIPSRLSSHTVSLNKRELEYQVGRVHSIYWIFKIECNLQVASCYFWSLFLSGLSFYSILLLSVSTYYPEPGLAKRTCHSLLHRYTD